MLRQRTLKTDAHVSGVGLHSGLRVDMIVRPAPPNTGIVFRRTDLKPLRDIVLDPRHITDTRMATTLAAGLDDSGRQVTVATIEHLLSALFGLGLDNLIIEINAPEVPILDGSAGSFVLLLRQAGTVEQAAAKSFVAVTAPVEVREGDAWVRLSPYFGFKLRFSINFGHPAIDATGQVVEIDFASKSYVEEIARARTFGFMQDVDMLRSRGLALGGNLDNAIVMDEAQILNQEGLRYTDEFAKHKILDAIGDLYVLGKPLLASYESHKGGHKLNNLLLRQLLEQPEAWRTQQFNVSRDAPKVFERDWLAA
jgi:UDP-3-O-[3-hydroxymyristoyl] N-acetylglucosamine deacetylase